MQHRYRIVRVASRGGNYYLVDRETDRRESLGTRHRAEALELLAARNEAEREPAFNLLKARVYLMASDPGIGKRTWQDALDSAVSSKVAGSENHERWVRAAKDEALTPLLGLKLLETRADQLLAVLNAGKVSTNVFLRRLHNFCIGMNWLPWPILPKKLWPPVKYKPKRAIKCEEHRKIIEREGNPERRAFYELCWHLGGSQTDIANLVAEDIDWEDSTICYSRRKLAGLDDTRVKPPLIKFGPKCAAVLRKLPAAGPLFPYLRAVRCGDRATEFKQRCDGLAITGVTLHSYRYAWAERAARGGMPERQAQQSLGHNSKAVHRSYAKRAQATVPSLEDYEAVTERKLLRVEFAGSAQMVATASEQAV